jgi:hypothetical protein
MLSNSWNYEALLRRFRSESGLYLLGAGTSAGIAPLGTAFWTTPVRDFLHNFGGFSVEEPGHSLLNQVIIKNSLGISMSEIFPGRDSHSGDDILLYEAILRRMPNFYVRSILKHRLAKSNFYNQRSDSYEVFRLFNPSLIANYNHDGLATKFCSPRHRVLDMHGTVDRGYGSPEFGALIDDAREYHLSDLSDGILMGVPEIWSDQRLSLRLLEIGRFRPEFITIIGYSFAWNEAGGAHDDHISLEYFQKHFRGFQGDVYVIDPKPDYLRDMLSERLKSKAVVAVPARWNVLAHAIMQSLRNPNRRKSLNYVSEYLLDTYGGGLAFPLAHE